MPKGFPASNTFSQTATAWSEGTTSSKPVSPVYPVRQTVKVLSPTGTTSKAM